eukprot:7467885-Pyramimonas_sp.AAC.1
MFARSVVLIYCSSHAQTAVQQYYSLSVIRDNKTSRNHRNNHPEYKHVAQHIRTPGGLLP